MDRIGRPDFADQLFGHGLDLADQQIVVDLFEWRFVGGRDDPRASSSQVNFVISRPQRRIFRERDRGFESTSLQRRVSSELGSATSARRPVKELLAGRALDISYETVGRWVLKRGSRRSALPP